MATRYWQGGAVAVKQVSTVQITAYDSATTYTITIGGIDVSVVGDTDVNTTATNLQVALEASTHPYFSNIDWTVSTDTVTATAGTAGVPFVASSSVAGGTGTIGSVTTSTASAGPNDWSTADNWDAQTAPASSDTVIFADNAITCVWGLAQSALTGMTIFVDHSYTGKIGLDRRSFATAADGTGAVTSTPEYRDHTLAIDWAALEIGRELTAQTFNGSSLLKFDNTRSASSETIIHKTGTSAGPPAVSIKTAHASAAIEIREANGGVGIGTDVPGETATVGTVEISGDSPGTPLALGNGVTITTLNMAEGTVFLRSAATVTAVTIDGGALTIEGDAYTITTLNANGGTVFYNGDVDITTVNLGGSIIDASGSNQARTITTLNHTSGNYIAESTVTITTYNEPTTGTIAVSV